MRDARYSKVGTNTSVFYSIYCASCVWARPAPAGRVDSTLWCSHCSVFWPHSTLDPQERARFTGPLLSNPGPGENARKRRVSPPMSGPGAQPFRVSICIADDLQTRARKSDAKKGRSKNSQPTSQLRNQNGHLPLLPYTGPSSSRIKYPESPMWSQTCFRWAFHTPQPITARFASTSTSSRLPNPTKPTSRLLCACKTQRRVATRTRLKQTPNPPS